MRFAPFKKIKSKGKVFEIIDNRVVFGQSMYF